MSNAEPVVEESAEAASAHAVQVTGTVLTDLQAELKKSNFTDACVAAITELITKLVTVADEAVARNELKPEFRGVTLTRKATGSPFFTVSLEFNEEMTAEDVTTITDRTQKNIDEARAVIQKRGKRTRLIDLSKEHDDSGARPVEE